MGMMSLFLHIIHPGGAERLVVDAAVGLQSLGHAVKMYTSHHDHGHCFEETRDGTLEVEVIGDFLPRSLFGQWYIVFAIVRNVVLAATLLVRWALSRSCPQDYDVFVVDQLSTCIPLLKLSGAKVQIYDPWIRLFEWPSLSFHAGA